MSTLSEAAQYPGSGPTVVADVATLAWRPRRQRESLGMTQAQAAGRPA